jgi:hypothetical protein
MNYDDVLVRNTHDIGTPKRSRLERLNRKNNSQNGLLGMHDGLSRHSRTYMIWSPTTGKIYHTRDCIFDENFNSTLAYGDNKFSGYLKMMVTDGQQDFDLPFYQVGLFSNKQRDDSSFDGMVIYEHDEDGILVEIVDYYHTRSTDGTSQLLLQVEYLYEQNFAYVDYKEFYHKHPEAVIAFLRRSDLIDYYPNGVIGTEVDHGPPCTIVGPLSPLLEEEIHNNNTNTIGDEAKTLYENGGESPSNQVSSEDDEAITNIDSLRTFTMKRHLPTDIDDDNDSITTTDDYEHETLPAAHTLDASPTDDNEPPPLLRRSIRRKTPTTRYTYRANVAIQQNISEIPDDIQIYMHRAYQADIVNSLDTTVGRVGASVVPLRAGITAMVILILLS